MKVCLGGTFSIIHAGHEALIRTALDFGDWVVVGLTTDEMASQRGKDVAPYEQRKQRLQAFIQETCNGDVDIVPLDDEYGPAASGACDGIVVSPETEGVAAKINDIRRSNNIPPLHIFTVPYVLADDGIPISSTRISNGEIQDGRRVIPLHVAVGTSSETKHAATEAAFRQIFGHLDIDCRAVPAKTPESPAGKQVWNGALQRAEQSIGDADYGVGIEAGISRRHDTAMLEHVCTLIDTAGYTTWGTAPAFQIPPGMTGTGADGAIDDLVPDTQKSMASYLSGGTITRQHLVQEAVTAALLPRLHGRH